MHIVLVSIGNFQEYILVNIRQLLRLGHTSIFVIVNPEFLPYFAPFPPEMVHCIDVTTLYDTFNYQEKTQLDGHFRGGFTVFTSSRFFYIHAFMKKHGVERVLHLENDVLLYYNSTQTLANKLDQEHIYIPVDSYHRAIASIVYIPTADLLGSLLEHYPHDQNDMVAFSTLVRRFPEKFCTFPIGPSTLATNPEQAFVTQNWAQFRMVFDAAAMGQYLGGVDPRNASGDTTGFVNETCVLKYHDCGGRFVWDHGDDEGVDDPIRRPYLEFQGEVYPIFNLHIHCKNLERFV